MITIRKEKPSDLPAVRKINEAAFGQPAEADIIDAIRAACADTLSLVAVSDDQLVGHIFFSPVAIEAENRTVVGMGLAPMAVPPEHQHEGIGSRLIKAGLDALGQTACPYVVVLGHPDYYPRFGFAPASAHNIRCQWDGIPDEAFMVLILDEARMKDVSGVARYRQEFDAAV